MREAETKTSVLLSRFATALLIVLCAFGLLWYGLSAVSLGRVWRDIFDRPSGPLAFRFLLQPMMAAVFGIRDGIKDARLRRASYFWTILSDPEKRQPRLHEGLVATARVILLGLAMDAIYQVRLLGTFYPGEAAIVAILLAFVPYLLIRGPAARVARWWNQSTSSKVRR